MDVHAGPATLPELDEFLAAFKVRFRRPEGEQALERYLTGLLTELPNKNCDTMAGVSGRHDREVPEAMTTLTLGMSAERIDASPCLTSSRVNPILSHVGWMARTPGELLWPWPFSAMDAVHVHRLECLCPVSAWCVSSDY